MSAPLPAPVLPAAGSPVYVLTTVAGIAITALLWSRLARIQAAREGRDPNAARDERLFIIYGAALAGAYIGAKLAFLLAEGWHYRESWRALLSGHSVTGALLGGTVAVETAKKITGYARSTGDLFAVTVPLALAIGRVGCIAAGCCQGVECAAEHAGAWWTVLDAHGHSRWPAAHAEMLFNLAFLAWATVAWRADWQRGQRFNIYLMAYGTFRFAHEFARDDARWYGSFGGYHVVALATVVAGVWMYCRRRRPGIVMVA